MPNAFCFLANKDAGDPYIVARVPGFKCILIAKKKDYIQNLADVGFQFERYVTGGSMMDTSNNTNVEHLHLMKRRKDCTLSSRG